MSESLSVHLAHACSVMAAVRQQRDLVDPAARARLVPSLLMSQCVHGDWVVLESILPFRIPFDSCPEGFTFGYIMPIGVVTCEVQTLDRFLVGTVGTYIQDKHSAQRNNSCENPMHVAYIIFGKSLRKLEAIGCRGEELDWCL
jgi:hypothetical protein